MCIIIIYVVDEDCCQEKIRSGVEEDQQAHKFSQPWAEEGFSCNVSFLYLGCYRGKKRSVIFTSSLVWFCLSESHIEEVQDKLLSWSKIELLIVVLY